MASDDPASGGVFCLRPSIRCNCPEPGLCGAGQRCWCPGQQEGGQPVPREGFL